LRGALVSLGTGIWAALVVAAMLPLSADTPGPSDPPWLPSSCSDRHRSTIAMAALVSLYQPEQLPVHSAELDHGSPGPLADELVMSKRAMMTWTCG